MKRPKFRWRLMSAWNWLEALIALATLIYLWSVGGWGLLAIVLAGYYAISAMMSITNAVQAHRRA